MTFLNSLLKFFLILLLLFIRAEASEPKNLVIFGAGYVGTVTGACFAKCGHKITFIDPDLQKVAMIKQKKSPLFEPQLEELLRDGIEKGLIDAKGKLGREILEADSVMIAVAVPTTKEGIQDVSFLSDVFDVLKVAAEARKSPLVVSIRSTLLPDAYRELKKRYESPSISIVINPEFLRESTAIDDFFHPPFCVAGGGDLMAVNSILSLYKDICPKRFAVSAETACLLKYACNAFHAAKITFTNEMASVCESLEVNPLELMEIFCEDKVLNCSSSYFKPGFSFGGSCLGKDLRALLKFGNETGNSLPLLSSIVPSNQSRFQVVTEKITSGNHQRLAIFGLSFKKNSDDLRESPFVDLIERLDQAGILLHIFDPDVKLERLTDANHQLFLQRLGHLVESIKKDIPSTLAHCDGVILGKDLLDESLVQQLKNEGVIIYDLGYFISAKKE